ncbi:hypothetical protein STEG23_021029, partial [Scotinomys teguina]
MAAAAAVSTVISELMEEKEDKELRSLVPSISQHSINKLTGEDHEGIDATVLSGAGRKLTGVTLTPYGKMQNQETEKRVWPIVVTKVIQGLVFPCGTEIHRAVNSKDLAVYKGSGYGEVCTMKETDLEAGEMSQQVSNQPPKPPSELVLLRILPPAPVQPPKHSMPGPIL